MKKIFIITSVIAFIAIKCFGQKAPFLKVGDPAPSISGVEKWIKGDSITRFKHGNVYVVEFGATWCTPCAAAIPHLSALALKYKERGVTVISVFVQENYKVVDSDGKPSYLSKVRRYVQRQGDKIQYNVAMDGHAAILDNNWLKAADKIGVPYTFIIDKEGRIAWIGSNPSTFDGIVEKVLNGGSLSASEVTVKGETETKIDSARDVTFYSGLSRYEITEPAIDPVHIDNFRYATIPRDIKKRGKIEVQGGSLRRLFYMAYGDTLWNYPSSRRVSTQQFFDTITTPHQKRSYGKYWYKPLLRVRDSSAFECNFNEASNRYDYIFKAPLEKASSQFLQKGMQKDMEIYFDYKATVENRAMPCWKITVSDKVKAGLKSKDISGKFQNYEDHDGNVIFRNADIRDIILILEMRFGHSTDGDLKDRPTVQPPFFDYTGIKDPIDFVLDGKMMEKVYSQRGNQEVFKEFKAYLETLGFEIVKSRKTMKVVIIRDVAKSI